MPNFVVITEQGPRWAQSLPIQRQEGWEKHAAFMKALEVHGVVLLGGPLTSGSKNRALLILTASDEAAALARLSEDPFLRSGVLKIIESYPWEVRYGRLP